MHSSGWDDEHVLALVETIHWAHLDAVHCFATNALIVDDVGHLSPVPADRHDELIHGVRHHGTRSMAENEHREDPHLLTGSEHQAVGHLAARGFGAPAPLRSSAAAGQYASRRSR